MQCSFYKSTLINKLTNITFVRRATLSFISLGMLFMMISNFSNVVVVSDFSSFFVRISTKQALYETQYSIFHVSTCTHLGAMQSLTLPTQTGQMMCR